MNYYERPREKAFHYGIETLSNRDLLAVIMRSGSVGESALSLADEVLKKSGGLVSLSTMSIQELMTIKGIKQAKAIQILASIELSKRISREKSKVKMQIQGIDSVHPWLNQEIGFKEQEHFLVMFLNVRLEMISYKIMFVGTESNANISVKTIFQEALFQKASRIICAHNHPSGDVTPSNADLSLTSRMCETGKILGIDVVDHVIVGKNNYISLKAEGYM